VSVSYTNALREKRLEVLGELDELRRQSAELALRISAKEGQLRNLDDLLAAEGMSELEGGHAVTNAPISRPSQRFLDLAYEILQSAAEPLHYRDLARRLTADSVYIPGQDPAANLLTQMSRDERFGRAAKRGMYGLREWPSMKAAGGQQKGSGTSGPSRRGKVAGG
jgi:hypothetical protein